MITVRSLNVAVTETGVRMVNEPRPINFAGKEMIIREGVSPIFVEGNGFLIFVDDCDADHEAVSILQYQQARGLHNTFSVRAEIEEALDKDWQFVSEESPLAPGRWGSWLNGSDYEMVFTTEADAITVARLIGLKRPYEV